MTKEMIERVKSEFESIPYVASVEFSENDIGSFFDIGVNSRASVTFATHNLSAIFNVVVVHHPTRKGHVQVFVPPF